MIRKMVLLVAFTLLLPCLAMAAAVTFTTEGFITPGLPLTFDGVTTTTAGGSVVFGKFYTHHCHVPLCQASGDIFTLRIQEASGAIGKVTGLISGSISDSGQANLTLTMISGEGTVTIGHNTYTIIPSSQNVNFGTSLTGKVLVPEPNAELLFGMGALGLMVIATATRKLIST